MTMLTSIRWRMAYKGLLECLEWTQMGFRRVISWVVATCSRKRPRSLRVEVQEEKKIHPVMDLNEAKLDPMKRLICRRFIIPSFFLLTRRGGSLQLDILLPFW
ncbi:uncharacterized protein A4U43_C09F5940 [Asparagus officinalis]|uniref:Uncharacterized protein n=1 Tax=Asparagus officinalis TaxID=4686 RepID=A0A5P1E8Z7_ASPOF|nr:uncharacterized protein A4U43_C09F5380 [Asparagus officinalis]ONK57947.1 uncharacterized protein A4U43_C09F5940 [Asparagus officinalis]